MTLEEIVNNLKSAGQDYGQLFNNNPRMDNFASVLQQGLGQLIPSNADFKSPEAMRDWGTAAALNAPMGLTFTGPKSMGWNHDAANTATKLLDNGADPAQVWKDHLIGRMPDKSLFSEIDDSGASHIPVSGMSSRISENLKHPELLGNYPYLDKISMSKGSSSYFSPELEHIKSSDYKTQAGVDPRELRNSNRLYAIAEKMDAKGTLNDSANNRLSNLMDKNGSNPKYANFNEDTTLFGKPTTHHEIQHIIQDQEGWARGGSPSLFSEQLRDDKAFANDGITEINSELSWLVKAMDRARANKFEDGQHLYDKKMSNLKNKYDEFLGERSKYIKDAQIDVPAESFNMYRRLTGEAQARATEYRMNMNMQQRRDNYPLAGDKLSDIPLDQLINRYGDNGPSMSMSIKNPNLNFELLNKHLSGQKLTPEEMALYEKNGSAMETPQLQRYNLGNANAQGGSPESRSKYLYDSFHGTPVLNKIGDELKIGGMHANRSNGAAYGEGIYSSNRPHTASTYSNYRQEPPGAGIIPLKIDKEDFLNLPALKESDKNLLGKYASNSMLPSERAYKMIGQERKEFKNLEDARDFFSQRQKDWEHFADGYDRAKPTASMENGTPIVDFINYNSDIPINTPHEAFSLMVNTGWDGVKELGYKGHTMHQGSGENWDVTNDTSKIRSRFAAFDPLRKNSSSLLASGLLGSLLLKQMNQESSQK